MTTNTTDTTNVFDLANDKVARALVKQDMTELYYKALSIDVEEAARIGRMALRFQETEDLLES